MIRALLRRFSPRSSAARLARALRVAARYAETEEEAAHLRRAADDLDAIWLAMEQRRGPSRDAMQAALGEAELDLAEKITSLYDVIRDLHVMIQATQAETAGGLATFHAQLADWKQDVQLRRQLINADLGRLHAAIALFESQLAAFTPREVLQQRLDDLTGRLMRLEGENDQAGGG